jgi:hypothetical protein
MARTKQDGADEAQPEPLEDGCVWMTKDGEDAQVHRSCVADHQRLGWKIKE